MFVCIFTRQINGNGKWNWNLGISKQSKKYLQDVSGVTHSPQYLSNSYDAKLKRLPRCAGRRTDRRTDGLTTFIYIESTFCQWLSDQ